MMLSALALVGAVEILPPPMPPVIRPEGLRSGEKEVTVVKTEKVAETDGIIRLVTASFVFENPNPRPLAAEFEFPIPEGAKVCGYKLEVNGEMIPGVVCEKEKARVAFENEQRKRVDPGLVEHVKGNVWKTRIFPLPANGKRGAEVSYIVEEAEPVADPVTERWGEYVYEGRVDASAAEEPVKTAGLADFSCGEILWDASLSRKDQTAADIAKLKTLPEKGDWTLVVFRNVPDAPRRFTSRDELVAAVEKEPCDGGTDLKRALAAVPESAAKKLLFSDETDTLNDKSPDLESRADIVFASRPDAKRRRVVITRRKAKEGEDGIGAGRLLATAWAARRIEDLSSQADARKDEFLALGREFGVASPVTSLIVLENLGQYLEHKIEPPKELSFHAEWVRRRQGEDDPIRAKQMQADFEATLLRYWQERVEWWKNPKPKVETPKSGLFGAVAGGSAGDHARARMSVANVERSVAAPVAMRAAPDAAMEEDEADMDAAPQMLMARVAEGGSARAEMSAMKAAYSATGRSAAATVTLAAWDPKTPYIDTLKGAAKGTEYEVYLKLRDDYSKSPAFFLDVAGWFFKAGLGDLAKRIISNLAEFKLEDPALWRTMAWRLRESGAYDESAAAFRHVIAMRGEEGQSYRDLAIVLAERGKAARSVADLEEAMRLFHEAAFKNHSRRAARRSNDIQVAVVALEELNGLIAWCAAQEWSGSAPKVPEMDAAFRRDLPMDLRIILSWDADETDIDIHVLEPNGEEAFYRNRRTREGGFVGEDVTTGYGPEEYLAKEAQKGKYKILSNYFASHQQALTGAATVTATVYTNWSRKDEARQILTLRLDKPKDKHAIGEVEIK